MMAKQIKQALMLLGLGSTFVVQSALMVSVNAEIFKCTNKKGNIYYNDKPCPIDNKEKIMQNEKDVLNGYVPKFDTKKDTPKSKPRNTAAERVPSVEVKTAEDTSDSEVKKQGDDSSMNNGSRDDSEPSESSATEKQHLEKLKILSAKRMKERKENGGKMTLKEKHIMLGIQQVDE
jgi:hypothetical protein